MSEEKPEEKPEEEEKPEDELYTTEDKIIIARHLINIEHLPENITVEGKRVKEKPEEEEKPE